VHFLRVYCIIFYYDLKFNSTFGDCWSFLWHSLVRSCLLNTLCNKTVREPQGWVGPKKFNLTICHSGSFNGGQNFSSLEKTPKLEKGGGPKILKKKLSTYSCLFIQPTKNRPWAPPPPGRNLMVEGGREGLGQ
jgi:hypothetical protein